MISQGTSWEILDQSLIKPLKGGADLLIMIDQDQSPRKALSRESTKLRCYEDFLDLFLKGFVLKVSPNDS